MISKFKIQIIKTTLSIIIFIIVYLMMLLLALGITILCIMGGVFLVMDRPVFLILGIGIASLGILIMIFLLKFMFVSHKVDRTNLIEITLAEESYLFDIISEIAKEIKTNLPKKVYLSTDTNAAVFYDSNFLSMIFPVKKKLANRNELNKYNR